jgi:hypothetical protein
MVYYYNLTLTFIAKSKAINETVIASARAWRWTALNASEPWASPKSCSDVSNASTIANDAGADDDGSTS